MPISITRYVYIENCASIKNTGLLYYGAILLYIDTIDIINSAFNASNGHLDIENVSIVGDGATVNFLRLQSLIV